MFSAVPKLACTCDLRCSRNMASDRASKKDSAAAGAGGGTVGATLGGGDSVAGMGIAEMRDAVISLLERDETVVQALRRLGKRTEGAGGLGRVTG